MTLRSLIAHATEQEQLNFMLTNYIPRRLATRFVGWFSKIEQPFVRDLSIAVWKLFSDLDLSEAKKTEFASMHDCFVRELKEGARPIDADTHALASPCDGIVGASGPIAGIELMQIKGLTYTLEELLADSSLVNLYRDGQYVTLRLKSSMYHRFHAPYDCRVKQVAYVPGDSWNVNPATLKRVGKLFCKNERAILRIELSNSRHVITLVPVAAILVASIRLNFLDAPLIREHADDPHILCDAPFRKGQEMGWFEHGSTIIVLAPRGFTLCEHVFEGATVRVGERLMLLP